MTLISRSREETRGSTKEEFPRCTVSSSSSNTNNSEKDSVDTRDSLASRKYYIKTSEHFRGTGQNG